MRHLQPSNLQTQEIAQLSAQYADLYAEVRKLRAQLEKQSFYQELKDWSEIIHDELKKLTKAEREADKRQKTANRYIKKFIDIMGEDKEWFDIEEVQPPNKKRVLVYARDCIKNENRIEAAKRIYDEWIVGGVNQGCEYFIVTHWRFLPEKPKKQKT